MIYLDHHAATPLGDAARLAMIDALGSGVWGNPSSIHAKGQEAKARVELARRQVASSLGAEAADVIFTSGGTEACNLAVLGLAHGVRHIVTTALEHPAMREAVTATGLPVAYLPVTSTRIASGTELRALIGHDKALVVLQWANHETGHILPIEQYAAVCRDAGARLVVDATQAWGRVPLDVAKLGVTALAVASHKIGGPSGAGALFVDRGAGLQWQQRGGAQERGRRAGSPGVLSLVGFGAAAAALRSGPDTELPQLRAYAEEQLRELGGAINAPDLPRLAGVVSASFRGHKGELLVAAMDQEGVAVASGPACSSGLAAPSPVLRGLYPDEPWRAESALRVSFDASTTREELNAAFGALGRVLRRLGSGA